MKTTRTWIIIVSMLVFLGDNASAYCILGSGCPQSGTGWPGDTATFHSNGFSGSNSTFDSAFVEALNSWNNLSDFSYSSISDSVDPCGGPDSTRGWKFDSTNCGISFGGAVLAVTTSWASFFSPSLDNIIDADITFNTAFTWDVHNGSGSNIDFRRVAVHELGHALGLGHDETFPAIMSASIASVETPQADDINGLIALYGGTVTSVIWVDFSYAGAEFGTESQPYNTLAEAINAVSSGGTVKIKASTTSKTIEHDKN